MRSLSAGVMSRDPKQTRAADSSRRARTFVCEVAAQVCGVIVTVFERASFDEIER